MTTVNKQISLGTDDCQEVDDTTATLDSTVIYAGHWSGVYDVGLRWQTVNIPQGSTITSAVLSLRRAGGGGTLEANVRGIDEDNTVTWATDNRPSQRSKTSATINADQANWGNWGVGWITLDISAVIKEIVDRGGWSANNALAIVVEDTAVAGDNFLVSRAYEYDDNTHGAKLDIVYTPAGGARPPRVFTGPFHGPLGGPI